MQNEQTIEVPVSDLILIAGQCGNIDVLLARLEQELEVPNIKAANFTRSEISLELEYLKKYIPEYKAARVQQEFLTAESRDVIPPFPKDKATSELVEASNMAEEAEALFIACEMGYMLDGSISCVLGKMLSNRIVEIAAKLRSVVLVDTIPF